MNRTIPKTFRCFLMASLLVTGPVMLPAATPGALDGDAAIQSSKALLDKKEYARALESLAPALQLQPRDPTVLNLKGAILTNRMTMPVRKPATRRR